MAVSAYASVLSLLRVVDNIQHPSHLRFFPDTAQIDALREKLSFLQKFLEVHSSTVTEDIECMLRKVPRVTCDAEILIDSYVVDQLYKELYPRSDVPGCCDVDSVHNEIHRVIQEIATITEALKTLKTIQRGQEQPRILNKITGDKLLNNDHSLTEQNKMVGFDDQLKQVLEKLTGNQLNLVIVPIVGMGGIGKTTLAKSVFDHPYNSHYFQVRIWLTISQDYSVKKVLQGLLQDGVLSDKKDSELGDEAEIITKLHQKLFGQRYLIVLDDVWSLEAWYDLKQGFPNEQNGSRVMVTTRLSDIANSLDSRNNSYSMKFLDEDRSWDLFSQRAFEQGGRSLELEEVGREISKRCKGLPLLLVLIGGLLANSNMTVEYWQSVKQNINSFANSANNEYCLRILSLSYHHLPIHLKACFLYMRHFEEDSAIKVPKLIEMWISHGFVKPMRGKSLEEAARIYLEDLIGRNMLLIRGITKRGNIRICGIHDLLRDMSIKESNKEQLRELPKTMVAIGRNIIEVCVICNEGKTDMMTFYPEILGSKFDGKISVCSSCESTFPKFARSRFVMAVKFKSQKGPQLTTYRSIALRYVSSISVFHTIRLIWNLECLDILDFDVVLPKELWEMPQLRYVKVPDCILPDPVSTKNDVIVLEHLQTLKVIKQFKFTEEIVRRIPNIRALKISYEHILMDEEEGWSCFCFQNLAHLQKLESLYIDFGSTMDFKKFIALPCSLKKLRLIGCKIGWEDLTIIGSLPNLEVLKLSWDAVSGEEWNPVEGEFLRLKYLKLVMIDLVHCRVDGTHFPALETLSLDFMYRLHEIPLEIGELPSLKSIYLENCKESVIDSARAIVEEQLSNGNEGLVVHVKDWNNQTYQIGGANNA